MCSDEFDSIQYDVLQKWVNGVDLNVEKVIQSINPCKQVHKVNHAMTWISII